MQFNELSKMNLHHLVGMPGKCIQAWKCSSHAWLISAYMYTMHPLTFHQVKWSLPKQQCQAYILKYISWSSGLETGLFRAMNCLMVCYGLIVCIKAHNDCRRGIWAWTYDSVYTMWANSELEYSTNLSYERKCCHIVYTEVWNSGSTGWRQCIKMNVYALI